jgi:hypothetical protein
MTSGKSLAMVRLSKDLPKDLQESLQAKGRLRISEELVIRDERAPSNRRV